MTLLVEVIIMHTAYYVHYIKDRNIYIAHTLLNSAAFGLVVGLIVSGTHGIEVVSEFVMLSLLLTLALILGIISKIRMPLEEM